MHPHTRSACRIAYALIVASFALTFGGLEAFLHGLDCFVGLLSLFAGAGCAIGASRIYTRLFPSSR